MSMALTKSKKDDVVKEVSDLLAASKLTVVAKYQGTTVKALQGLRRDAKETGTKVKVVKNRLLIKALQNTPALKGVETTALEGMLLYAFNDADEVAPAKSLNDFAKANPTLEFVGAITADGQFLGAEEVKALAVLPSKNQLIAGLIYTLNAPVNGVMSSLSGNLHALLKGLEAKATN
jgi:large subunit ribosomal protein L10